MENCGRFVFYNNIYFFCEKPKTKQRPLRDMLRHFHGLFKLLYRPHFLWVYRRDNPRAMLGEHSKSLQISRRTVNP